MVSTPSDSTKAEQTSDSAVSSLYRTGDTIYSQTASLRESHASGLDGLPTKDAQGRSTRSPTMESEAGGGFDLNNPTTELPWRASVGSVSDTQLLPQPPSPSGEVRPARSEDSISDDFALSSNGPDIWKSLPNPPFKHHSRSSPVLGKVSSSKPTLIRDGPYSRGSEQSAYGTEDHSSKTAPSLSLPRPLPPLLAHPNTAPRSYIPGRSFSIPFNTGSRTAPRTHSPAAPSRHHTVTTIDNTAIRTTRSDGLPRPSFPPNTHLTAAASPPSPPHLHFDVLAPSKPPLPHKSSHRSLRSKASFDTKHPFTRAPNSPACSSQISLISEPPTVDTAVYTNIVPISSGTVRKHSIRRVKGKTALLQAAPPNRSTSPHPETESPLCEEQDVDVSLMSGGLQLDGGDGGGGEGSVGERNPSPAYARRRLSRVTAAGGDREGLEHLRSESGSGRRRVCWDATVLSRPSERARCMSPWPYAQPIRTPMRGSEEEHQSGRESKSARLRMTLSKGRTSFTSAFSKLKDMLGSGQTLKPGSKREGKRPVLREDWGPI